MRKYFDTVIDLNGNVVPGALASVTTAMGTPVQLYTDAGPVSNPINQVVTNTLGLFQFYIVGGTYTLTVQYGANAPITITNVDMLEEAPAPVTDALGTYFDTVGGVTNGTATFSQAQANASILQSLLSVPGTSVFLPYNNTYQFAGQITPASGSGIYGYGNGVKPILYMPSSWFTNTAPNYALTDPNTLFIYCNGITGFTMKDVTIQSDPSQGRWIQGLRADNCVDIWWDNVEVFGFPAGLAIYYNTVSGRSGVNRGYFHDFYDNTTGWTVPCQTTAITSDGNIIGGVYSKNLRFTNCQFINIYKGDAAASLPVNGGSTGHPVGQQCDGINLGKSLATGHLIDNCYFEYIDEPMDIECSEMTISNCHVKDALSFGLKLIHGASNCVITNIIIDGAGVNGLVIQGTSTAVAGTVGNTLSNINIKNIGLIRGVPSAWVNLGASTYGFRLAAIAPGTGVFQATDNSISDCKCDLTGVNRGWQGDNDANASLKNVGTNISFTGTPSECRIRIDVSTGGFYNGSCNLKHTSVFFNGIVI